MTLFHKFHNKRNGIIKNTHVESGHIITKKNYVVQGLNNWYKTT